MPITDDTPIRVRLNLEGPLLPFSSPFTPETVPVAVPCKTCRPAVTICEVYQGPCSLAVHLSDLCEAHRRSGALMLRYL